MSWRKREVLEEGGRLRAGQLLRASGLPSIKNVFSSPAFHQVPAANESLLPATLLVYTPAFFLPKTSPLFFPLVVFRRESGQSVSEFLRPDLVTFLRMRFPKGSVDHDLQNTIRDNVYTNTVPCKLGPATRSRGLV